MDSPSRLAGTSIRMTGRACQYGARPPLAMERLSRTADGHISLRFKRPLSDGSTQVDLSPTEFLRRLANLVPPKGFHLVSYHGVFAPRSHFRRKLAPVPTVPSDKTDTHHPFDLARTPTTPDSQNAEPRDRYLSWAELLRRTRGVDILQCPRCGGRMKLLAFVTEPKLAAEILPRLGLQAKATGPPN